MYIWPVQKHLRLHGIKTELSNQGLFWESFKLLQWSSSLTPRLLFTGFCVHQSLGTRWGQYRWLPYCSNWWTNNAQLQFDLLLKFKWSIKSFRREWASDPSTSFTDQNSWPQLQMLVTGKIIMWLLLEHSLKQKWSFPTCNSNDTGSVCAVVSGCPIKRY